MKFKILLSLILSIVFLTEVKAEGQEGVTPLTSTNSSSQDGLKKLKEKHNENVVFDNDYNVPSSTWK